MKPSVLDFKLEMKISQRIPKPEKPRTKKLSNPTSTSTKSIKKWPWPCHRVTQLAHGVGSSWTQNHWEQGHFYPTKGLTSNLYMVAVGSRPLMVYCQPWNFGVHHLHIFSQRRFAQVVLSFLQIFSASFCLLPGFYMLIPAILPVLTSLIPKILAGQSELPDASQQVRPVPRDGHRPSSNVYSRVLSSHNMS